VKVSEVQKPYFLKEYASISGPKHIHTRAAVSQCAYTCGMKEEKAHTVGGSHEELSVRWCQVLKE
jgi:hypothetical protein